MMKLLAASLSLLVSCTTIDYHTPPANDWPQLTVVEHYGIGTKEMSKHCEVPWFMSIQACMVPDFKNKICNLYFPNWERKDVSDRVYEHELMHCEGYDNLDDTELHDLWEQWKQTSTPLNTQN